MESCTVAGLTPDHFRGRALMAYNGTLLELKEKFIKRRADDRVGDDND